MRPGPGLAPAGDSLFFVSPKKSKPKKGDPTVRVPQQSSGQPAVLASGGVCANSLHCVSLKQCAALIRLKLCSSAQPQGMGADSQAAEQPNTEVTCFCSDFCLSSLVSDPASPVLAGPVMCSKSGIRAAHCLSRRRVWAAPRFLGTSQVARSEAQGPGQPGRLSLLTFFGEAKKVSRPPGRTPGQQACEKPTKLRIQ